MSSLPANLVWHHGIVGAEDRHHLLGQRPLTVWLTGLSGAGKSTLAVGLDAMLLKAGRAAYVLDGDNVRHGLNRDLGFAPADRSENIRRVAEVARLMNDAGLIVITAFISPYQADRRMAQEIIGAERYLEVYLNTPLAVCEARDPKGLYKKARQGSVAEFTGINAPYEIPNEPTLTIDTSRISTESAVAELFRLTGERIVTGSNSNIDSRQN